MWHKARKVSVTAGQTEIKIEFPLPIVACNLMIEYADFYENIQGKTNFLLAMRALENSWNTKILNNCIQRDLTTFSPKSVKYLFPASSETLQCPRCSASVPANPGVCSNCGENVFQCHKCRSINYDEKVRLLNFFRISVFCSKGNRTRGLN